MGELVDGLKSLKAVAGGEELLDVGGLGDRIAGDIEDSAGK
jgi:hypothetical protein